MVRTGAAPREEKVREGRKPFVCSALEPRKSVMSRWNKALVRKSDYTLHGNRNHSASKPFPCLFSDCTQAYASRFELTRQEKVHSFCKEM